MTRNMPGAAVPGAQEPPEPVSKSSHPTLEGSGPQIRDSRSTVVTYGCAGCNNRWAGVTRCHCSRCHRTLSGIGLFDAHQRGGACTDPATMNVRGEPLRLLNGVWCGPELPAETLAKMRGNR